MSDNPKPADEKLKDEIMSFAKFKAARAGLTEEQFANIANFIPGTRATFPGLAVGYAQQPLIGTQLMPEIVAAPDGLELASFVTFGKESYLTGENDIVQINAGRKSADYAVTWTTEQLDAHAMDAPVDIRLARALATSNIDASVEALELVRSQVELSKEVAIATLVRDASKYDATGTASTVDGSGTTAWGNSGATPIETILQAKETVRSKCGMYPNTFWLSPVAFQYLRSNPEVQLSVRYAGSPSGPAAFASQEGLSNLFGMNVIVGLAISTTTPSGALSDVWGTDAGLMVVGNNNLHTPKFGATFTAAGSPKIMPPYLDRRFGAEGSMIYSYVDYYKPFITFAKAGYLWTTVGATS